MSFIQVFVALASISAGIVYGQQGLKGNSIIPFPRVGRSDNRFFMAERRNGNSPGLIPFPRIGRSDSNDLHEIKRQLIPFPRVGKRPYWHYPMEAYNNGAFEYEDYPFMVDPNGSSPMINAPGESNGMNADEIDNDKRNAEKSIWFGPRVGKRRKRSISESTDSSYERSRDSTIDTKSLVNILHSFKWAIVPIRERRTFTPRLGRSSDEVVVHSRAQHYSPRLGRSREVASVELDVEDKAQNRASRSDSDVPTHDNNNETPPTVVYTPRLGRDQYTPRLGRSGEDHQ